MSVSVGGAIGGILCGVVIGWFAPARYWGMPLMKIVGPIPATALIPMKAKMAFSEGRRELREFRMDTQPTLCQISDKPFGAVRDLAEDRLMFAP